jgi:hypothetical protein
VAEKIPSWPKVTIRLYDDHNAEVKIAGRSHPVNHQDPRQAAIALVSERAGQLGRPVKATAVESDGASWPLIIHPDGRVEAVETDSRGRTRSSGGGGGGGGGNGQKPIWPIILAFVLAGVLIFGTILYVTVLSKLGDGTPTTTESPKLPSLPEPSVGPDQLEARPVPPGWSTKAGWTVDLADDSVPAVSPDGSEIAVLTPDQKIAVFDNNGKVLWQDKVPKDAQSPVYTVIDSKPVVAVASGDTLYYWAGDGAKATEIELPDSSTVQFFGTSPLVLLPSGAGASVVSNGELKAVPDQPRNSTMLLAEGDKALMARYTGPLYWSQPGKDRKEVDLPPPPKAKGIDHIVAASPGQVLALWQTGVKDMVMPVVHSTVTGAAVAICPTSKASDAESWQWVPENGGNIAAWGECMINFTAKGKTSLRTDFQPLSITGTTVYGTIGSNQYAITPGAVRLLQPNTARPWGIAGSHAIVVYDSVLYALDKS